MTNIYINVINRTLSAYTPYLHESGLPYDDTIYAGDNRLIYFAQNYGDAPTHYKIRASKKYKKLYDKLYDLIEDVVTLAIANKILEKLRDWTYEGADNADIHAHLDNALSAVEGIK
ncbi:MAG: hypothetical protein WBA74_08130 [Cyclobacteriaceae bacterium]